MSLPAVSVFNDGYIAELYEQFRRDPSSVDESWRQYFRFAQQLAGTAPGAPASAGAPDADLLRKVAAAADLVSAIQRYGHMSVQIDPLGSPPSGAAEMTPEFHGLTESDLRQIPARALGGTSGTGADVVARMRQLWGGNIGFEYDHLENDAEREWFRQTIESQRLTAPLTNDEKKALLKRMTEVDGLERFLGLAFVNVKRFSIEGVDALVPMIDEAIARAAQGGTSEVVIGMAHRGRLNVLSHVMGKPYERLFEEFLGKHHQTNSASGTGDVKYHLGYSGERDVNGSRVALELVPNPSHLEFVNPVVSGVARAKQRNTDGSRDETRVLPVVVHGDASFAGEGVVAETLNLSLLNGYRVGGTFHILANNQVGFTTDPIDARSTHYSSDLAKGFEIPVLHVNADDPEGCLLAVRVAIEYRQHFKKDVLIDLVGYRRHGHNEADQPAFTQPRMYDVIKAHPSPREVFGARLVREGVVTEEDVRAMDKEFAAALTKIHGTVKEADRQAHPTGEFEAAPEKSVDTAVRAELLTSLNEQLLHWPTGFTMHSTIMRTLPRRREALTNGGIDWGHAEALAFASLLTEGIGVRLTGQDAQRGTFSHRQATLHDINTGATYTPLANLPQAKAPFEIYNSPLSETAVMGFEYGFSTAATNEMVLWEGQFGDFANVAQPIIDQFLAADRAKWGQDSSLVLLLPHGFEGQGPEHSSARLERFLQMCAEGNMVVAYPSTPAQYFHILRRHGRSVSRRPLVLMQPKSLLRMPEAASRIEDLSSGVFQAVIGDAKSASHKDAVRRLVFCTGKMYYDLIAARAARDANGARNGVAIARVEEIYPWPHDGVAAIVDQFPNVEEVVWAQEEPKNMGAWTFVSPRLRASTGNQLTVRYMGRPERASPAEGYHAAHVAEQTRIVNDVLTIPTSSRKRAKV
ncbi:MAG TPA: 2-oxoglutarate dehydrogenase E1 component [Gemmatimonadaceae bacterium]